MAGPATAALAKECAAQVDEDGGIPTRNPEELLEVFTLLTWASAILRETGHRPPDALIAAIDRIAPDHAGFAAAIAAYGETDLFCYRAATGEALADRQAEIWDRWLQWAQGRYDISFVIVEGIMHQPQPAATLEILRGVVAARGAFELAAMAKLAHLSGSLIATLAVVERAATPEDIWNAACLDELWQEELWGADHWAQKNRDDRAREFMAAARFLDLLTPEI